MSGYCQEYHIKLLYEVNTGPSSLYKLARTGAPVFLINARVSAPGQPYLRPAPQLLTSGSPAQEPLCWWLIKAPDIPCRVWEGRNKSHFQLAVLQPERGPFTGGTGETLPRLWPVWPCSTYGQALLLCPASAAAVPGPLTDSQRCLLTTGRAITLQMSGRHFHSSPHTKGFWFSWRPRVRDCASLDSTR